MTTGISPQELAELQSAGKLFELIDVRTPAEFGEVHVPFARNVPLDRLDPSELRERQRHTPEATVYVICRLGSRGAEACAKLRSAGVDAVNVAGGTLAWDAAGLPVVRGGRKVIPLDGQVRIAIGLIVLVSSLLAAVFHPYWIALAAFMGAGLIFSGISGFCGLARILGRMPWNQACQI
jgi:rhodanese-related sulfurtransferase